MLSKPDLAGIARTLQPNAFPARFAVEICAESRHETFVYESEKVADPQRRHGAAPLLRHAPSYRASKQNEAIG